MASARIQRWALILSAYSHIIAYKPGGDHINADVLSRLPLPEASSDVPLPRGIVLPLDTLHGPLTAIQIKQWTDRDPLLSSLRNMALHGRYSANKEQLRPFTGQKDELSIQDGYILWRTWVVIPQAGHAAVMRELHEGHPGICWMKSLARSIAWWPGIDADLERMVKDCHKCQINRKSPAPAPLHSSKWPTRPWARIHIDFAGPFLGKQFLVVVDAHSKWLEVVPVLNLTSQTTIGTLRSILATHGLPELLVSDNRSSFTSAEFHESMKHNGINHITSCPLPSSIQRAGQISHSDFQDRTGENYINRCSNFLSKIPVPIPDNTPQHNWSLPSRAINGSMTSLTPRSHASIHRDLCVVQSGTPEIWAWQDSEGMTF